MSQGSHSRLDKCRSLLPGRGTPIFGQTGFELSPRVGALVATGLATAAFSSEVTPTGASVPGNKYQTTNIYADDNPEIDRRTAYLEKHCAPGKRLTVNSRRPSYDAHNATERLHESRGVPQKISWTHPKNETFCGMVGARLDGKALFLNNPTHEGKTGGYYMDTAAKDDPASLGYVAVWFRNKR